MTTNEQVREQERRALYHLAQLAMWPYSTQQQPNITRQDEAMRDYAQKALTEIAALSAPPTDERVREWYSLCVECGPNVTVDEDGCCSGCGSTAMGAWLDAQRAAPPEPKPDATGGEAEDCCLTCGATLQEEQRDYCSPECAPSPEAAGDTLAKMPTCSRCGVDKLIGITSLAEGVCVHCRNAEHARKALAAATAELERVRGELAQLRREAQEADIRAEDALKRLGDYRAEREAARSERDNYAKQIAALRAKLEAIENWRCVGPDAPQSDCRSGGADLEEMCTPCTAHELHDRWEKVRAKLEEAELERDEDLAAVHDVLRWARHFGPPHPKPSRALKKLIEERLSAERRIAEAVRVLKPCEFDVTQAAACRNARAALRILTPAGTEGSNA